MHYANTLGLKKTLQKGGRAEKPSFWRRHRKKILGLGAAGAALGGLVATGGLAGLPALGTTGLTAAKTAGTAAAAKAAEGLAKVKPIAQKVSEDIITKAKPKLEQAAKKTIQKTAEGLIKGKEMASDAVPVVQQMAADVGERVTPVVQQGLERAREGMDAFVEHPATQGALDASRKAGLEIVRNMVQGPNPDNFSRILSAAVIGAVENLEDPRGKRGRSSDNEGRRVRRRTEEPAEPVMETEPAEPETEPAMETAPDEPINQ